MSKKSTKKNNKSSNNKTQNNQSDLNELNEKLNDLPVSEEIDDQNVPSSDLNSEEYSNDTGNQTDVNNDEDNTQELLKLRQQVIDLEKESVQLTNQLDAAKNEGLRHLAELENVRRRKEIEKQDAIKFANSNLISDILPVLDSFDLASIQVNQSGDESNESIKEGLQMIKKQIEQFLTKLGVEKIESLNQPFDPNLHQGISKEVDTDKDENTVIREMQPGYKLNDRVIRPSMVVVSTKS